MLVTYPALFYYDDSQENTPPYFVTFPDFKYSATQGGDISEALLMASEWLGLYIADCIENEQELPKPSDINSLSLEENNPFKTDDTALVYQPDKSFSSMVVVDVADFLEDQEPVKKTLTIPKWADKLGHELGLNFSKTLTNAIAEKKLKA